MRIKKLTIFLLTVLFLNLNQFIYALDIENYNDTNCLENSTQQINISLKDIELEQKNVEISDDYDKFAILTFNVINTSLEPLELSQIKYEFYQDNKLQDTFINTEQDIYGFLGKLDSGENKIVKICVSLENMKQPIVLFINNDTGNYKYNIKQTIDIA
ncbi:hypothetical protein [Intestinibacter bartlettii]|uniref:Telomeric repeat-binding factor 2 n=1 Tax=Intestinibacter bartlettii TaxID=261299 RepID=A0ABS6DY18_9FIRM|nr:hypothetical protein [Intestinibacter bartlettii]MBU5336679.1 hypothetical protein [Intestinibacter bartlettii]MDO5011433.1 hypothetical protein [Intestinibacter bartlettii]